MFNQSYPSYLILLVAPFMFPAGCQSKDDLTRHAEAGHSKAQYDLGRRYLYGLGGSPQNIQKGLKWLKLAAEQGSLGAQMYLGNEYKTGWVLPEDEWEAFKWYRMAAEQGHAEAQYNLGFMYEYGRGVTQNDEKAVTWYRKAAAQGHAEAQYDLGLMYCCPHRGPEPEPLNPAVPQDYFEAAAWLKWAAEQGHADAQHQLGLMYEKGQGVQQDYVHAWLNLGVCAAETVQGG